MSAAGRGCRPIRAAARRPRLRAPLGPLGPLLFALALVAVGAPALAGQEPATEEQVPLAPDRSVVEVGPDLRRDLGLFPGVDGFTAARLFRTDDGRLILEISARRDGRIVRERRPVTEEELAALRADLDTRFARIGRSGVVSREGRGGLVLGQTLLGLGFYSWAVPFILDLEGDRASVATALLTAGASFYVPFRLTRSVPVTETHRNLALWGATRGILYGYLAGSAAAGVEEDHDRLETGAALTGSVAGSLLGYRMAEWAGLDKGTGTLWTTMTDIGSLAGLGVAQVAGFFDDVAVERSSSLPGETFTEIRNAHPRAARLTVLAGAGAGLAAGRWLGARSDWTDGDVFGLRSTTALGGQLVLPVVELFVDSDSDRDTWYAGGLLAGGVAGIAVGERLFRDQSFSGGDGLLLNAGHVAGGLTALGLTWLAVGDEAEDELLYVTTTALGSAAGFALTYRALAGRRGRESGSGPEDGAPDGQDRRGMTLQVHPLGLTGALLPPGGDLPRSAPLLSIRF